MSWHAVGVGAAFFVGGGIFASLAEYWAHRVMHQVRWLGKTHRRHHARGTAQGVLLEYAEYVWKTCWLMWPPFLISVPCGLGWLVGTNLYAVFSAFSHQLQHENPGKCFWLTMPIHFVHHAHNQWHHNFGVTVDVWDHVFGTYQRLQWRDRLQPKQAQPGRRIWQINWLWGGNAIATDVTGRQQKAKEACNPGSRS
ncbi:MAG TPA: sterol desaturase family protein [Lacipirellulaceae bacterium]|nr:sterol desaturase family protein [Lacipirellulaceae bacterium]